jgi:hypothetical protein
VLGAALLIFGILAVTGHATQQPWYHSEELAVTPDSVVYTWWHGWDSVTTIKTVSPSTISWYIGAQDTTINFMYYSIYWPGLAYADGYWVPMGNNYLVIGDSVWCPIRTRFCVPADSIVRTTFINWNSSIVPVVRRAGPVYSDLDSIHITDTDYVEIFTTYYYSGVGQTMTQQVGRQNKDVTGSYVVDTLTDTVYFPDPPSSAQLCRVYGWVGNAQQRTVGDVTLTFSLTENVVNVCDSAVMISTSFSTETNGAGYFYIDLIRSSCLQTINAQGTATGRAKYNVLLDFGGQTKQLRPFTVPDSTTCRLWW